MGYFDTLTSSSFKRGQDGRMLFFPWGVLGRGFIIPSEKEYERLRQLVKRYYIIAFPLVVGSVTWKGIIGGVVVALFLLLPYMLWARATCQNLIPAQERLSLTESYANQARSSSSILLWLLELGSLIFIFGSVLILVLDPNSWLIALLGIIFSGSCAFVFARMIRVKNKEFHSIVDS